jgi:uncharacterized protein (TIGR02996 family)
MGDVMCIVSKAIFEKLAGKKPTVGTVLGMERYVTANKALSLLTDGGKLYLVTVRPPDESLWLVGVLENPEFDGNEWAVEAPCTTPITDISALREKIKFTSGKGISSAAGTLGMSLQTPRELTADDAALIDELLPHNEPVHEGDGFPEAPDAIPANTGERKVGDALVQAVIDEPYSDLARQVFADALQARNDPRGEFVVLELALAGPLAIRKRDQMKARRDELFAEHKDEWFPTELEFRTRGGFVSAVTGTFAALAKSPLFANQPIVEATITKVDWRKLVRAPWLRHLHHLILRGSIDGATGFEHIVAAPNMQQLTALNVTATSLKADAIKTLKSYLPGLRSFVLTGNTLGSDGIAALIAWPHLATIETLYLSKCGLTTADVAKLLSKPLPNLVKLTLADNQIDNTIGKVLAAAASNVPKLEQLELAGNKKLDATAVKELGAAKLPAIRRIDLRKTRVRLDDIAALPLFRAGA